MSFKKQIDDYQEIWEKYSRQIKEGKLEPRREPVFYGRNLYDKNNPPFLAAVFMIPSTLWESIQLIQVDLEQADPRQKYHQPSFFHITLEEYGWEDQVDLGEVLQIMKKMLANYSSFEIQLKGLNCFPRTIYIQVFDASQSLFRIYKDIHKKFPNLKEEYPDYIPHVTIADILTDEARSLLTLIQKNYRIKEIGQIKVDRIHIVKAISYLSVGRIETIKTIKLA
ncbi:MAG: 2'-5' RNA ligase family protein [Promethearchaeota archaeon]